MRLEQEGVGEQAGRHTRPPVLRAVKLGEVLVFEELTPPGGQERPATETDVGDDGLFLSEQGDVLQDDAHHALALTVGRRRVPPKAREVGGQGQDLSAFVWVEDLVRLTLAVVVLLGSGESAQLVVPLGLKGVRDQPVVGVHAQIAPLGEVGLVARPLDLLTTQPVRLLGPALELFVYRERHLQGERADDFHQQFADGLVETVSGSALALCKGELNAFALTAILGKETLLAPEPGRSVSWATAPLGLHPELLL